MQNTLQTELWALLESMGFTTTNAEDYVTAGNPKKEGERRLGEMNLLEKTCHKFLEAKGVEHEAIHEKIDAAKAGSPELVELEQQHALIKQALEIAKGILWSSVRSRFNDAESTGFGLREGNNIVALAEEKDDPLSDFLSSVFSGMSDGMPGFSIGIVTRHKKG